jgi:hypothetical protein
MCDMPQRVARLDRRELREMPAEWTDQERGEYLGLLLKLRGIDCQRLFRLEYYPQRQCWLVLQRLEHDERQIPAPPSGKAAELFYTQTIADLRRSARAAHAALAGRSVQFALYGSPYRLPDQPEALTPAALAELLDQPTVKKRPVHFTSEGGWKHQPSDN